MYYPTAPGTCQEFLEYMYALIGGGEDRLAREHLPGLAFVSDTAVGESQ